VSEYFQDYITVAAFAGFGVVLMASLLGISFLVRPSNPTKEKLTTYECGVDPVGSGWNQSFVRYYVFGLLFVLFDVEAVFLFPWAIVAESLGVPGLIAMIVFILTLLEGLLYAVRKGVMKWE
jgi:NADH-quinone oxidoreductase subunit A